MVDYFNREALTVYRGAIRAIKVWKHIWVFLFHMAIYVAFVLYQFAVHTDVRDAEGKPAYRKLSGSPNKEFRLLLADELCKDQREHTARVRKHRRQLTPLTSSSTHLEEVLEHTAQSLKIITRFKGRQAECAYCRANLPDSLKGAARKHAKRTSFGCATCGVGLHLGRCFLLHHTKLWKNEVPIENEGSVDEVIEDGESEECESEEGRESEEEF